ncbi:MAG: YidC/Oxa1 family membrane protein insertase, partial [Oscillospiraceae bacterium]|nr:YidC/Oxa1 family membrane protein insertase [Oscillospiraceae bacterium]
KTGFVSSVASGKANAYIQIEQCEWISRPENFEAFAALSDKLRQVDYSFLGMNLGQRPAWNFLWTTDWSDSKIWLPGLLMFLIPIISALASYFSSKISMKMNAQDQTQQQSMGAMFIMMPLLSLYIGFIMPTALGIYWLISTVLGIVQDVILTKYYTKKMAAEDEVRNAERAAKEAELEEKRRETERKKAENATERNKNTSKRKQAISERQERMEKAQEWDRLHSPAPETNAGPSQVGTRKYARGRAYDPQRFDALAETPSDVSEIPELEDIIPEAETDEEALLDAAEEAEEYVEEAAEEIEEVEETDEDNEEPEASDEENDAEESDEEE